MSAIVGDDRDRFPIEAGQCTYLWFMTRWMKRHSITDLETEHFLMLTDLAHETQPLHNLVIEFVEFGFSEMVDVNFYFINPQMTRPVFSACRKSLQAETNYYPFLQFFLFAVNKQ